MQAGTKHKRLQKKCGSLPEKNLLQKDASFAFDEKMHAYLIDQADTRGAQRLRRAAQPHFGEMVWRKGLVIDVAVITSLLAAAYVRTQEKNMVSMIWCWVQSMSEGKKSLRMIFRFVSKRLGREFTSYCGRAWARVSCNLPHQTRS
jgi:hypothetical protein